MGSAIVDTRSTSLFAVSRWLKKVGVADPGVMKTGAEEAAWGCVAGLVGFALILRGPLGVVDDQNFHSIFGRLQLQSKLILDGF